MQSDPMQDADEAGRVLAHKREVVTVWAFGVFLIGGMAALGIYAMFTYS